MTAQQRIDPQAVLQELQAIDELIATIQAQLNAVNASIQELEEAEKGLTAVKEGNVEAYTHAGALVFVPAKLDPAQGVLAPLGAGYFAVVSPEKAVELIRARMEELGNARRSLEEGLERLLARRSELISILRQLGVA